MVDSSAALNRQNDYRLVAADSPPPLQLIDSLTLTRRKQLHRRRCISCRRWSLDPIPHTIQILRHNLQFIKLATTININFHYYKDTKNFSNNHHPFEEERVLLEAVKEKGADYDETKRLEAANMRLVVNLINQYQHRGLTLEELVEAGEASLRNAIMNFNLNSGIKFITYAVTQMRQYTEALTPQNCPKDEEKDNWGNKTQISR